MNLGLFLKCYSNKFDGNTYSGSELVYMCIWMGKTILIDAPQGCEHIEKPTIPLKNCGRIWGFARLKNKRKTGAGT